MISKKILVLGFAVLTLGFSQAQNPFYTGSGDIYYNNGDVGIGTSSPQSLLQLNDVYDLNFGNNLFGSAGFSIESNTTFHVGTENNSLNLYGGGDIHFIPDEQNPTWKLTMDSDPGTGGARLLGTTTTHIGTSNNSLNVLGGSGIKFRPSSSGVTVFMASNGKVGIGTETFSGDYNLYVTEGIRTEEVLVDVASANGWADYVFEEDYVLMPLSEVEQYIKAKKHLPEIPSADEVVENGVKLKEMNALLLKKVEELTLYTIQLSKELEAQREITDNLTEIINPSNH